MSTWRPKPPSSDGVNWKDPASVAAHNDRWRKYQDSVNAFNTWKDRNRQTYQFDRLHKQRDTFHASTLQAQRENQRRQLLFQRQQADRNRQFQYAGLQLQRQRAQDEDRFRTATLQLQRSIADDENKFRQQTLQTQERTRQDELKYRNQLLDREDAKFAFDKAERQRVREDTKEQFNLQLQAQKEQFDKTFAFNEKRAAENDKARIQAQVQAEAGARRQVLSSLGYHNQQDKIGSPIEKLLTRLNRNRNTRRLRVV